MYRGMKGSRGEERVREMDTRGERGCERVGS